jgi:FdrA protein
VKTLFVEKESYYDSALLMLTSQEVKKTSGVHDATVAMGTAMNLDLLRSLGFDATFAGRSDAQRSRHRHRLRVGRERQRRARRGQAGVEPQSEGADRRSGGDCADQSRLRPADAQDDANLAVISLPGAYAAREARKALESGLHVMLFSDNVSA